MATVRYTKRELVELWNATVSAREAAHGRQIVATSDSDAGARAWAMAEALYGIYYSLAQIEADQFLSATASTDAIEKHAEARLGPNPRKAGAKARGANAVTVTGTIGSSVPIGATLSYSDGTQYVTTTTVTLSTITGTVSVEAVSSGLYGNRDIGETLTFDSPPAGINASANIFGSISGGTNPETDGELIARVLDAYRNPRGSGRFSDWRQWALQVEGVADAYPYGPTTLAALGRRGLGIVDVAVLASGTGAARIPSAALRQSVIDYLDTVRPAGMRDFGVVIPVAVEQDIIATIVPKPGYSFDWERKSTAVAPAGTVAGYSPSLRRIETYGTLTDIANASYPIAAGKRVLLNGNVYEVAQVISDIYFTITEDAKNDLIGAFIYPAGPLSEPLILAIRSHVNSLGPAKGNAGDPNQDWDSTLRISKLYDIIMSVNGVLDCTITTPSASVVPEDDGTDVELVVYGEIAVAPAPDTH